MSDGAIETSFRIKQAKIPTNEARIRWGTSRPSRKKLEVSTPIHNEVTALVENLGLKNAPTIIYGKCNPAGAPHKENQGDFEDRFYSFLATTPGSLWENDMNKKY